MSEQREEGPVLISIGRSCVSIRTQVVVLLHPEQAPGGRAARRQAQAAKGEFTDWMHWFRGKEILKIRLLGSRQVQATARAPWVIEQAA